MASQYDRVHAGAYFRWQFFEAYYPTVCMTAWADNVLVGMFGCQKRALTDGTPVGHCIDLLIAPAFRGLGLFAELGRHAAAYFPDVVAMTVFPNKNGRNACVKALGMREIAKIDDMILTGGLQESGLPGCADSQERGRHVGFCADGAYRAWRFDRSPQYGYETMGKGVTKTFREPATGAAIGDIVDWIGEVTAEERRYTVRQLLERGHASVSTWGLPTTRQYRDLRSMGFVHVERERYFCLKLLDRRKEHLFLYDIESWRVVPADAEIY